MIDQPTYRVRMVIYDDVETTVDEPAVKIDEPFYGEDELAVQAQRLGRDFRRHLETEQ